jgi:lipopolysaccharide/colanic/teichoic acid biosynthesis glycosyltransferase
MVKRFFDVCVSFIVLAAVIPVIAVIAVGVARFLGRPILFRQGRPGFKGKPFEMIKFRTMLEATDVNGKAPSDNKRLTKFGSFLRSTSMDELPELWNVLRGNMSLVGPRPLLMEYLPLYSKAQYRRHEVKPGITGWAQVNGRNAISWEEKFELDVWYVDNRSFLLDLKIILLTVKKVLFRDGISAEGESTMSKFTGTKK